MTFESVALPPFAAPGSIVSDPLMLMPPVSVPAVAPEDSVRKFEPLVKVIASARTGMVSPRDRRRSSRC